MARPATDVYVIQTVMKQEDAVSVIEEWIDYSRGVIAREISCPPGGEGLASSFERSSFQCHPAHVGAWVPMRIESRTVSIVNEVTEVLLSQNLSPSFFQS